jgi:hypothetical protein
MNTTPLQPADLLATDDTLDQALLEMTATLPDWLRTSSEAVRETYRQRVTAYHAAAARLEAHLDDVLPSFETFTNEQVAARIHTDLGIDVAPELLVIDLPKSVSRDYDIDPQFARVTSYAAPWIAGTEREQFSLSELARLNFASDDEQMAQRLTFAETAFDEPKYVGAGLTATYLHRLIPQLNVAQGYRTLLSTVFRVRADDHQQADLLLEPYEHKLQLEGFCAFSRRRLSEEGYQMFEMAAQARSRTHTDAVGLEMSWVQFKPGVAASGERDSHTLSGWCALRDRLTGRTLIYLPDAPGDQTLIEASSPAEAKSRLIQWLIRDPALVDYLAERTEDSAHKARHVSYIHQALARRFEGFIDIVPALDLQLSAQQLHLRAGLLHRMTEARARSTFDINRERSRAQNDAYLMYFRALLGVLPGVGTLISVKDGLASVDEASNAFSEGRLDDGLLASAGAAMSVLDVALSIVPGALGIRLLTRTARRGGVRTAASAIRTPVLIPFEGYEVQASLMDALPQTGRDIGTYLKDGQLWIHRKGRVYAAYRRSGEQTLRLRKTAIHGYEPPLRLQDGNWVYHADVGLKGGMKSTIAETLIAKAHADPAFKNRQARALLDQFEFPAESQRRLELDAAVHYEKHWAFPDWTETYRRSESPQAASPQPGPSGVKRKEPPAADGQAKRAAEAGTSASSVSPAGPDSWKSWGRPLTETGEFKQIERQPPVFRIEGEQGMDFIQMNGLRYEVLPSGSAQHPSIVFLKNPATLQDSFSGLNETIRLNRFDQPIMASFTEGQWAIHGPMFKRKLQQLVEQARPGLTPTSYRVLAEKLFDRCDAAHAGLTSTKLINLRATLNAWQTGQLSPLSELRDPILMLEGSLIRNVGTPTPRLGISYGPSLDLFTRLDFAVDDPALRRLLGLAVTDTHIGIAGRKSMRDLMTAVLEHAGYSVVSADEAVFQPRTILLFRRPGQEQLYLLKMRYVVGSTPRFRVSHLDDAITLSNRWIDEWLTAHAGERALDVVVQARNDGRLVKLVGGIKSTSTSGSGTQVFMQRIAGDF